MQHGNNSRKSLVFISFPSLQGGGMIKVVVFHPNGMNAGIKMSLQFSAPMRGGAGKKVPLGT